VAARSKYKRCTRLDFDFLYGLVVEVQKDPALRDTLLYRPNTSLYRIAGGLRYVEARWAEGQRSLHLVAVTEDEPLSVVLHKAWQGATLEVLAGILVDKEATLGEAKAFIHELIDNQLLVPDLEPPTTGPEPLPGLVRALERAESTRPMAEHLARAGQVLADLDAYGLGNPPASYLELASGLEELPGRVDRSKLWQVDLFKPAPEATLGKSFQEAMEQAIGLLYRLTPVNDHDPFKNFKQGFLRRYEQRWVPLVEALDPECGIGFPGASGNGILGAPNLEGLTLGPPAEVNAEGPVLKRREAWLLRRLTEMRCKDEGVLLLSEEDVKALSETGKGPLPVSFSFTVGVSAASPEALEAGMFQALLLGAGGPTAARMLGRFCHGDPELSAEVIRHLRIEESSKPRALFAEIAHLPSGRMGNVMARPHFRNHEIPYLGAAGMDPEQRVDVRDLLVGIDGTRVVLWSRRHDKEIVPRLSSAVNYRYRTTDLFRFLATLQDQGTNNQMGWTWGGLGKEPWLPRVVHGKFILSRATWQVTAAALKPIKEAKTVQDRFKAIQQFRKELQLPRHALLADGDNELPIDLDNPLMVEAMWGLVGKRHEFKLSEDVPGGEGLVVQGPEGGFTHELVLAFLAEPAQTGPSLARRDMEERVPRHGPGSEWLFAKLYTGLSTADQILAGGIGPLLQKVMAAGDADRWFFIRYQDPEPHIRLRIHGEPSRLWSRVLPGLQGRMEPFLESGWLWNFLLDTYEPETGRYGGPDNINCAEAVFQADSEAAIKILALYAGDECAETRWRLALRSVDDYYACLDWSLEKRFRLAAFSREKYAKEFGVDKGPGVHQLSKKFRSERKALEDLLDPAKEADNSIRAGIEVLEQRTALLRPLFKEMLERQEQGKLTQPIEEMMGSLVHMSVNRFLRSAQRMQELVIYDFLTRIYESRLAKERVRRNQPS
jgi:thiopeptide-type bacteriocin biosynthesis protein